MTRHVRLVQKTSRDEGMNYMYLAKKKRPRNNLTYSLLAIVVAALGLSISPGNFVLQTAHASSSSTSTSESSAAGISSITSASAAAAGASAAAAAAAGSAASAAAAATGRDAAATAAGQAAAAAAAAAGASAAAAAAAGSSAAAVAAGAAAAAAAAAGSAAAGAASGGEVAAASAAAAAASENGSSAAAAAAAGVGAAAGVAAGAAAAAAAASGGVAVAAAASAAAGAAAAGASAAAAAAAGSAAAAAAAAGEDAGAAAAAAASDAGASSAAAAAAGEAGGAAASAAAAAAGGGSSASAAAAAGAAAGAAAASGGNEEEAADEAASGVEGGGELPAVPVEPAGDGGGPGQCPEGTVFSNLTGECAQVIGPQEGQEEPEEIPPITVLDEEEEECPEGSVLIPGVGCKQIPTGTEEEGPGPATCPLGTNFDPTSGECEALPREVIGGQGEEGDGETPVGPSDEDADEIEESEGRETEQIVPLGDREEAEVEGGETQLEGDLEDLRGELEIKGDEGEEGEEQVDEPEDEGEDELELKKAPVAITGDNIYVAWWANITGNDEVMFRASTDGGATFADKINLSNSTGTESQDVEIAAEGDNVIVTWWERNQTAEEPVVRTSNDNGATFGPLLRLATNGTIGVAGG